MANNNRVYVIQFYLNICTYVWKTFKEFWQSKKPAIEV